jgi:ribosomal protein L40E
MKLIGILILVAGLLLGARALTMDVGVDVPARDFGYGVSTPAMKVANLDLMTQRQNYLIFSGILAVVGAILTGFASMRPATQAPVPVVLREGEGLLDFLSERPGAKAVAEQTSVSICPKCRSMSAGDAVECGRCGAALQASA